MTRPLFDDLLTVPQLPAAPVPAPAEPRSPGRVRDLFAPPPVAAMPPRPRPPAPPPTLATRRFLLNDRRVMPELVPGRLALHVAACSMLNEHLLWLWQVERYAMDPHSFRVLAAVRAVPVSLLPGVVRWLPANELAELPLSRPLVTADEQREWHPVLEVEAALAAAEAIRGEPDVRISSSAWLLMEQAATAASLHPADATAGLVLDTPQSTGLLPAVVAVLRQHQATEDALRTMLIEMGLQSDDVSGLLRPKSEQSPLRGPA